VTPANGCSTTAEVATRSAWSYCEDMWILLRWWIAGTARLDRWFPSDLAKAAVCGAALGLLFGLGEYVSRRIGGFRGVGDGRNGSYHHAGAAIGHGLLVGVVFGVFMLVALSIQRSRSDDLADTATRESDP
jgi:hypothetical protein